MPGTAVILAGGRTAFPNRLRALLPYEGKPLVHWTARALSGVAAEVIVATAAGCAGALGDALPKRFRVIEDEFIGLGPLGGLHAGALAARHPWVLVAPCESIFSSPEMYRLLLKEAAGFEGAVPFISNRAVPLHAVYRRGPLVRAIEGVLAGGGELADAVGRLRLNRVGARRIERADPGRRGLRELKNPEEIRAAERPEVTC